MTGTATLNIHVKDLNDNVPQLNLTSVDVCVSDGPTTTSIAAFDLDGEPYGGPFSFKLLGDVKGKWKLKPSHGRNSCYIMIYWSKHLKNKTKNNHLI